LALAAFWPDLAAGRRSTVSADHLSGGCGAPVEMAAIIFWFAGPAGFRLAQINPQNYGHRFQLSELRAGTGGGPGRCRHAN
jgi:hypothetical protein